MLWFSVSPRKPMTNSVDHPPQSSVNFFSNFNRVVGAAFLAIIVLTLGFFVHQINEKRKEELAVIQGHMRQHSQFIEFVLRSSLDYLESLRTSAQSQYLTALPAQIGDEPQPTVPANTLFHLLRQRDTATGFDLNELPDRDSGGNLTGIGALAGRSTAFYRDISAALALNQAFRLIIFNLPSAVEASFTSIENFSITSPWLESSRRKFVVEQYDQPIWLMGTPATNPNREKYWAPVHFGGKDVGLLVPAGAPVYHQDDFRGVVSIKTSLDYLNRINADFGYSLGTVMLLDAHGTVLAHPKLAKMALEQQTTSALNEVLPTEVLRQHPGLLNLPENSPTEVANYVLIKHSFISAPWSLVYLVPSQTLWMKLLQEHGGPMLAMFLGLVTLIIVMYVVTAREFIVPATKLVQHLAAESEFRPAPMPKVPFPWRPWFETISKAFRESLTLMTLRQELDIAAKMQQAILPRHWPSHENFSLWGAMRSAKEVGGDFYDHFQLGGDQIGLVVADVSGKGVPAALFGMVSKTLLRATATQNTGEPGMSIAAVNDGLCQDNDTCMFVTVFYAVFHQQSGRLSYVNAGHPPPLLLHADGSSEFLRLTNGIALGVADGLEFAQQDIQLQAGDYLIIYTDGVTEAFNPQNEEFTQDRLVPLFEQAPTSNVQEAVNRVIRAVDAFADSAPQSDDITCMVLHFGAAPLTQTEAVTTDGVA